MAKQSSPRSQSDHQTTSDKPESESRWERVRRLVFRIVAWMVAIPFITFIATVGLFGLINPPITTPMALHYIKYRAVSQQSVALDLLPRHLPLAFMAAEDSEYCHHWGFNLVSLSKSDVGGGASISQQTARNLFLGQSSGGTLFRLLESFVTGALELILSKRRIMELYLNTRQYHDGVFGVAAAARQHFDTDPIEFSEEESALLAVQFHSVEKEWSDAQIRQRRVAILEVAQQLGKDGRASCIEG